VIVHPRPQVMGAGATGAVAMALLPYGWTWELAMVRVSSAHNVNRGT
jgi:hypothetical protein